MSATKQAEIVFEKRKFTVRGVALVPVACELVVEADSAEMAILEAYGSRWQKGVKMETASQWDAIEFCDAIAELSKFPEVKS